MYLEEIVLEGFKSYATRTTIGKFDKQFNAITGLNGSGKSNILDAICFVLGIAMDKVRATNMNDLIYKKGQAGITKASVTLIFNNTQPPKSKKASSSFDADGNIITDESGGNNFKAPLKYEDSPLISVTRQILVGGKGKYIVNGKAETLQNVQGMFQSVQLNIHNPNFLIMQGKITLVLSMKAPQILGMVEEAAGTRLYEDRKEKALKVMEKKELKLNQSALILSEEISPILEDLRQKKKSLQEYQKISQEMEEMEKVVHAFNFTQLEKRLLKAQERESECVGRFEHLESVRASTEEEILEIEERMGQVERDRSLNGGGFSELEEQVKGAGKEVARLKALGVIKSASIKEEEESLVTLRANLEEAKSSSGDYKSKSKSLEEECEKAVKEYEAKLETLKSTESLVQTITTGLGSSEGKENGYMDQLRNANLQKSQASSEIQQLKLKLSHLAKEIKAEEPKARQAKKENGGLVAELESKRKVLAMLNEQVNEMQFDEEGYEALSGEKRDLEQKLKGLQKEISELERQVPGLSFEYSDPTPHFDRSKVKGLVATLISIPKEHHDKANALEVCAGGKLYQVVVDTQEVASQLIQNGKLKRRVTIIPLNKISAFKIQAERVTTAKQLAPPGSVDLALSLVGSEKEVSQAMAFVFGGTLICKDPSIAKLVTFDKRVNARSVTLDGDVYDPSGQLSGGAKSQSSGMLLSIQRIKALQAEQAKTLRELNLVCEKLRDLDMQKQLFKSRVQEKEMKEHELTLHENRMANNPHFKLIQHVENIIEQHKKFKEDSESAKVRFDEAVEKVASIEKEIEELSDNRESKVESLKKNIKAMKKEIEKLEPSVSKMKEKILVAKENMNHSHTEIAQITTLIENTLTAIKTSKVEEKEMLLVLREYEAKHQKVLDRLNAEKKSLARFDKEILSLEKLLKSKKQNIEDFKIESRQLTFELNNMTSDLDQARRQLNALEKENAWIQDQKDLFGKEGSAYDFSKMDTADMAKRIKQLKARHDVLGRTVDRSALEMFERVEKKEIALKQKLSVVQKDKTSIQSTLEYLDRKKLDQLLKTWEKVDRDFGTIFSDLLPGNTCKLVPTAESEGDITQGLEIKVCLGGVWKTSLAELSGGQRSLIALSLILALLQFNPAPMYILDEVDAALDLSHTQNIGKLLKTRFKTSQFILVSLKDGMYNNANVLFRTKFVDGVSQVSRIAKTVMPIEAAQANQSAPKPIRRTAIAA